mmetsp:Transcript_28204/g.81579  ORF Transcript_28204/g.81579 Transcript_28204/m.81579 type:complete len:387 (+) Transcript_28204:209-1369(+)
MSRLAREYHVASLTDDIDDVEGGDEEHSQQPPMRYVQQDYIPSCLPAPLQEKLRRDPRILPSIVAFAIVLCVFVVGFWSGEHHEMKIVQNAQQQQQQQLGTSIPAPQPKGINRIPNSDSSGPKKFLVFAEQRTGSRFLTDLLDDHPSVRCGNEELNHPGSAVNVKHTPLDEYMDVLDDTWNRLSETDGNHNHKQYYRPDATGPASAVGFKAMYNQGPMYYGAELLSLLGASDVRVIHLVRRNKLQQYISTEANHLDKKQEGHNAHPHTEEEAEKLRQITVSGKPNKVLHFMRQKTEEDARVSDLVESNVARDHFEIVGYEELSDNTQRVTARLFDLLGVDAKREVETDMAKIHKDMPTRNYFEEEEREGLREALEQSEFAWVLEGW